MTPSILLIAVLSAAPVKLASPGLTGIHLSKDVAVFYSDHLAQQLALRGLSVMTATEINSMIGLERQKQLLGCSDVASSCMAELADALGVDGIVTGSVAKFDKVYQLDVKVVSARDGRKLGIYSGSAADEKEVLAALTGGASQLSEQVLTALGRSDASGPSAVTQAGGPRRFWWAPAAVGVAALAVGAVMMVMVSGHQNAIRTASTYDVAMSELSAGMTKQTVGITALAVGGAAVLAAGALYLFGAPPVAATPVVNGSGGGFALVGTFP